MAVKSVVTVNTSLPSVKDSIQYLSGESLRDYDIALFDPQFPHLERIYFNAGGSCFSIESTKRIQTAMAHWSAEIRGALQAGKTVFVLVNEVEEDQGANSAQSKARNQISYSTSSLNNYSVLPVAVAFKNTKGRHISVVDPRFRALLEALSEVASYRAVFARTAGHPMFSTKDGAVIASVNKIPDLPGHLVFLPYFNLKDKSGSTSGKAFEIAKRISLGIVGQLIAIDKLLRQQSDATPAPQWVDDQTLPKAADAINAVVKEIDAEIAALSGKKEEQLQSKERLLAHTRLLYENGKALESAIEDGLRVLGFTVENYREGDLEIDHVIVGPSGIRMIGESEGKDTSAIDISKFRQLESNINEDFQQDEVEKPAKGVLFGNGFRFTEPNARAEQFTAKCFTNAKRLGTALVRTTDMYEAVVYVLDHPKDEEFRLACCTAIEETRGEIVAFPQRGAVVELNATTA